MCSAVQERGGWCGRVVVMIVVRRSTSSIRSSGVRIRVVMRSIGMTTTTIVVVVVGCSG